MGTNLVQLKFNKVCLAFENLHIFRILIFQNFFVFCHWIFVFFSTQFSCNYCQSDLKFKYASSSIPHSKSRWSSIIELFEVSASISIEIARRPPTKVAIEIAQFRKKIFKIFKTFPVEVASVVVAAIFIGKIEGKKFEGLMEI